MSEQKELTGILSKLEDEFAYARTSEGNVFIPIAAARNKKETLLSLKDKFAYNEEVRLIVISQSGKNNCKFQAKSIKKMEQKTSAAQISDEIHGPIMAQVTSTTESYAFAHDHENGSIFVPGDAFDSKIVKRVNGYIKPGDTLALSFKEQIERNGCTWVAISAEKMDLVTEEEEKEGDEDGIVIVSVGIAMDVESNEIHVYDESHTMVVICPILTYTGGKRGVKSARTLFDVVNQGDHIMYRAVTVNGTWEAIQWKQIVNSENLEMPKKINTSDSSVQTPPDLVQMLCRTLLRDHPEEQTRFEQILEKLPENALPEQFLVDRDRRRFGGDWKPA